MGKKRKKGYLLFEEFYEAIYKERWANLKKSLTTPQKKGVILNCYSSSPFSSTISHSEGPLANTLILDDFQPPPVQDSLGLLPYYIVDAASLFPVSVFKIEEGDKILDLCAAPGGKALCLAFSLKKNCQLKVNEFSKERRLRLKKVVSSYLPNKFQASIEITPYDAKSWCLYEQEAYDKILLDAPCSSEAHLLKSSAHLENWTPKRTKMLSKTQFTMLASAIRILKPGGVLVYSTCSISPYENDDVIKKALERFEEISLKESPHSFGEKTKYGTQIFPDKENCGPIYYSILSKSIDGGGPSKTASKCC